jgi:predicted permease
MRLSPNFFRISNHAQWLVLAENLLREVRAVGGVESADLTTNFPFNPSTVATGPSNVRFQIEGRPSVAGEPALLVDRNAITPGYFQTLRQPLIEGRLLTDFDDANALPVAVINQTLARHRWPGESPIGKRFSFEGTAAWIEIVGVVGDAKRYGLDRPVADEVYRPAAQAGAFASYLVVRTSADPAALTAATRAALRKADSELAVDRMATMEDLKDESITSPRVTAILLGLFAALALIISASGIAAVMALAVSQRTNELGIRMALGASRESILYMVLRQGLALAAAGTLVGIAGALLLTRLMASLLYATSTTDVLTFAAISALFLLVAGVACLVPARQITGIDPLRALRQE